MKKSLIYFLAVAVLAAGLVGCEKSEKTPSYKPVGSLISFRAKVNEFDVYSTKATPVSSIGNTITVNAVRGEAGADEPVWSNFTFTKLGTEDVWQRANTNWPSDNQNYRFYAVSPQMGLTYAAEGASVLVSDNSQDIVVAYSGTPSYNETNTLAFNHIFARLYSLKAVNNDGFTLSDVSIKVTPKVRGVYNIYGGNGATDASGWSDVTASDEQEIANLDGTDKQSDIFLVPGTYTLTATWTVTKGEDVRTYTNKTATVNLVAGKTNKITATLPASNEIAFTVSLAAWEDEPVNATFPTD